MKDILERVAEISAKYEQLNKISGNAFNVFDVINVTTNEVRLHSRFIAELLNPKGSHGQDDLFLKLFIEQLGIEIDTKSATVIVEKYIGVKTATTGGYLDIYISDKKGNSITIENKIYAGDQEHQLLRYYNFSPNNLLYLNLDGNPPAESSYISTAKNTSEFYGKTSLDPKKDFEIISYKNDIKNWLTTCRKEAVELPLLREGITHYLNLIKILTGQSGNDKMNTEITTYITASSSNLQQAISIEQNIAAAKTEIQWKFWESLKNKMKNKGLKLVEKDNVTKQNVINYYSYGKKDIYFGFWVKIFEKEEISIHFGIELEHHIYFGFTLEENEKGGISNLEKYNTYKNIVSEINSNYTNNKHWLGWRHTEEKLNFKTFNSDAIFNLADPKKLEETTTKIADNILIDITTLKNKLQEI